MFKIYRALLKAFTATAFAEAGEFETARLLLQDAPASPAPPRRTETGKCHKAAAAA